MYAITRQIISVLLLLSCVYVISAQAPKRNKPLVVSSASIFADIASTIGDTLIESVSIVPIGGDPHIYEPTPGDVQLLNKADLILQNGLTFEGWISDLIKNSGSKASVVTITEGIEPIRSEMHQNAVDPHAWMDPVNGKMYAQNIHAALLKLLPEHQEEIQLRFEKYLEQLEQLDQYVSDQISRIDSSKRILITSHDAFQYYGRRYGLRLESVLGTSTDADVKTSDMVRLNEVIRNTKVPAVFIESTINPKLINQVASDNNIVIGGKLFSDSLGDPASPAGTYLGMIRHNTDVIIQGLTSTTIQVEEKKGSSRTLIIVACIAFLVLLVGIVIWKKRSA